MDRGLSTGAQMVRAAQSLADERVREEWPYLHVYPPPSAIPVHLINYIAAPTAGLSAVVLSYAVPEGFMLYLRAILQVASDATNFPSRPFAPGDALWTVRINTVDGVADSQAMPVQGLIAVPIPLGSFISGSQWPLPRAYEFAPLDVVESVCQNVNLDPRTATLVSGFFGYLVPVI